MERQLEKRLEGAGCDKFIDKLLLLLVAKSGGIWVLVAVRIVGRGLFGLGIGSQL